MSSPTVEEIQQRAQAGDGEAQFILARLFDREGRHDVAVGWLKRAADGGHAMSANYLGARLMTGQGAPFDPVGGAKFTFQAADGGNGEACARAAVLSAVGVGRKADWKEALGYLRQSVVLRHPGAAEQLAILEAEAAFQGLKGQLDLDSLLASPARTEAVGSPRIWVIERFCSPAACAWVARRAEGRLEAARTYDAEKGGRRQDEMRTNTGTGFGLRDSDLVITLLRARIARATDIAFGFFEPVNVLHYDPGQKFDRHYDFIDPEVGHFADDLRQRGQRQAPALVYLNDASEGGETDFPEIGYSFKGDVGDLLVFFNVGADGRPDKRTLHAGTPPASGEKWVLSQWIRDKTQPII